VRRPRRPSATLSRFVVIAVTAVAGLGLASTSVALAAALAHPGDARTAPSQALSSNTAVASAEMVATSQQLGQELQTAFPRSYGGLVLGASGRRITVYMTRLPRTFDTVVGRVTPARAVSVRHSAHSYDALLAVHERLTKEWLQLQGQGIDVVGYDPDVRLSKEQIQVIGATQPQVALLDARYGRNMVTVESVGVAPIPASYTLRVGTGGGDGPTGALLVMSILEVVLLALLAYVVVRTRRTPTPATA
jgi:hypothetical protein